MIPPKPSSAPLTPAQKSAITKAKNKSNKATRAAQVAAFWELYDAEEDAIYNDRKNEAAKHTAAETAAKIARIKNPPPRNAPLVMPPRIVSKDKLTDAKTKRAEEAALRNNPPPDPNAPKPTKQPPTPKPVERPAPKPNYALPRTKNDITGNRNNALRAAGEANRANPGESRHHQYLLEHEGVRVSQGNPSTPVVPTPTIPTNLESPAPKQLSRPAPKLKPYTPTSVLTGIPKPRPGPAPGYMLGQRSPSPSKNPPLDQSIIRRNWEFAAPWHYLNPSWVDRKNQIPGEDEKFYSRRKMAAEGKAPYPVIDSSGHHAQGEEASYNPSPRAQRWHERHRQWNSRRDRLSVPLEGNRPHVPMRNPNQLTLFPNTSSHVRVGEAYALGQRPGQLTLFPRGNNEGVVRRGAGEDTSPQLKPTKVSAKQLQLELPNPNPRKDPPLQYTPPKPPPNTGKGRLVPAPKSDIKISGPTSYNRARGTRGAIRGAKGFGGGALSVLGAPLAYGVAFGIKERSFSGFLKGLDVWASGGTLDRGPDT